MTCAILMNRHSFARNKLSHFMRTYWTKAVVILVMYFTFITIFAIGINRHLPPGAESVFFHLKWKSYLAIHVLRKFILLSAKYVLSSSLYIPWLKSHIWGYPVTITTWTRFHQSVYRWSHEVIPVPIEATIFFRYGIEMATSDEWWYRYWCGLVRMSFDCA